MVVRNTSQTSVELSNLQPQHVEMRLLHLGYTEMVYRVQVALVIEAIVCLLRIGQVRCSQSIYLGFFVVLFLTVSNDLL